jgi:hypothetical protein
VGRWAANVKRVQWLGPSVPCNEVAGDENGPRLCLLCRSAWIQAASAGAQIIQPPHVQTAIEQVPSAAGLLPPPTAPTSL